MSNYDYIIIGSDIFGLTCAYYLTKLKKKILLIDENKIIGNNYSINRVNGLYSETKYYKNSFTNLKNLLFNYGIDFYELFNQNYNSYYPKVPNDIGLYKSLANNINKNKLFSLKLNTKINNFNYENNNIKSIVINSKEIFANKFIYSKYIINNIIVIYYHWNYKFPINKIHYFNKTDWNITYEIVSDNTYFNNIKSTTVIAVTLSDLNNKSTFINKSPKDSSNKELVNESFRQLKQLLISLPKPTYSIINKNKNYNNYNLKESKNINYFYDNYYNFELSVINGIKTINKLEKTKFKIYREDNIVEIIEFLFLISFILYIFRKSLY